MSTFFASLDWNDRAEILRRQGRYGEALAAAEHSLKANPGNPRGLLLQGRILYHLGRLESALLGLHQLKRHLLGNQEILRIIQGLGNLQPGPEPPEETPFATETMAELHIRQGYLWEAMRIYQQLYLSAPEQQVLWPKILALRDRLQERLGEGEESAEQLQVLEDWIQSQEREK